MTDQKEQSSQDMLEVKNINQLGLIYIYTMLQSAKEEDTFFSSLHIKITEIGGILEKKKKTTWYPS